jgi:hypothetical protein
MGDAVISGFGHVDETTGRYVAGSATVRGLRNVQYPLTAEQKAALAETAQRWSDYCDTVRAGAEMRRWYAERLGEGVPPDWFKE